MGADFFFNKQVSTCLFSVFYLNKQVLTTLFCVFCCGSVKNVLKIRVTNKIISKKFAYYPKS